MDVKMILKEVELLINMRMEGLELKVKVVMRMTRNELKGPVEWKPLREK